MKVTYQAQAYLPNYSTIEAVASGLNMPMIAVGGDYFESQGYPNIGTVEVTITLHSEDQIVAGQIAALQTQLDRQRADAYMAERAILDRISKLQALTFVEATHVA